MLSFNAFSSSGPGSSLGWVAAFTCHISLGSFTLEEWLRLDIFEASGPVVSWSVIGCQFACVRCSLLDSDEASEAGK